MKTQNKVSHTPGPWQLCGLADNDSYELVTKGNGFHHPNHAILRNCNEANARLIASAPELLAASKKLIKSMGKMVTMEQAIALEELREIIAKAEGK